MKPSLLVVSSLATLLLLSSCVRSQTKDDKAPPHLESLPDADHPSSSPSSNDTSGNSAATVAGSAPDIFRSPPLPDSAELSEVTRDPETGCELRGQFDGELYGTALGEGTHFDLAAAQCLKAGDACAGVTSQWYVAFPWVAVGAADPFKADEMSYARTFLRWCPEPEDAHNK
jgi:hypothetical protein